MLATLSAIAQVSVDKAQVTAVEHQTAGDHVRVVVHFDRPVRYVEGTAVDPYRIFFDLQGTRPADALASRTVVGDSILRRIRVSQYQPDITRVVLDIDRPAPYSAAILTDPPRLVVEISRAAALAQTRIVAAPEPLVTPAPSPAPAVAKAPAPIIAPSDGKLASRFSTGASGDPRVLLEAAQHGDPNAQLQMGDLCMAGHGVACGPGTAAAWYRAAAQQGHAVAASNLGVLYANGRGVPKSDTEAVTWFRKAADAGDAGGQNNLGAMYIAGRGVAQNDVLGAKWLLVAAERGAPEAQYALGTLYANGRGVPRDDAQAVKWLKAAAAQDYTPARLAMGKMYVAGAGVPRDYAEAMQSFRSADTPDAWYQLGLLYQQGLGVAPSDAEAEVWWLKAAQQSSTEARSALGRLYLDRDPVEAYSWLTLAAASGDKEAVAAMNWLAPRLTAQQLSEAQQRAVALAQPR